MPLHQSRWKGPTLLPRFFTTFPQVWTGESGGGSRLPRGGWLSQRREPALAWQHPDSRLPSLNDREVHEAPLMPPAFLLLTGILPGMSHQGTHLAKHSPFSGLSGNSRREPPPFKLRSRLPIWGISLQMSRETRETRGKLAGISQSGVKGCVEPRLRRVLPEGKIRRRSGKP